MSVGDLGSGGNSQDVELNLAPIIDSFVVLISFMLISAAFLSIGILDAGISAAGVSSNNAEPPPIQITVELKPNHSIQVSVKGKQNSNQTISSIMSTPDANSAQPSIPTWNYEGLTKELQGIHAKWSAVSAVTLQAEDSVQYKDVVKTMDIARKVMPAVLLGGF